MTSRPSQRWRPLCEVPGCRTPRAVGSFSACEAHRCTATNPRTGRRCSRTAGARGDRPDGLCQWCAAIVTRCACKAPGCTVLALRPERPRNAAGWLTYELPVDWCDAHRCHGADSRTGRRCRRPAGRRGDRPDGLCQWCAARRGVPHETPAVVSAWNNVE